MPRHRHRHKDAPPAEGSAAPMSVWASLAEDGDVVLSDEPAANADEFSVDQHFLSSSGGDLLDEGELDAQNTLRRQRLAEAHSLYAELAATGKAYRKAGRQPFRSLRRMPEPSLGHIAEQTEGDGDVGMDAGDARHLKTSPIQESPQRVPEVPPRQRSFVHRLRRISLDQPPEMSANTTTPQHNDT